MTIALVVAVIITLVARVHSSETARVIYWSAIAAWILAFVVVPLLGALMIGVLLKIPDVGIGVPQAVFLFHAERQLYDSSPRLFFLVLLPLTFLLPVVLWTTALRRLRH